MVTQWRTSNDSDEENEYHGLQAGTTNTDPSKTQQHFAKDADLNTIVKRYGITDGAILPAAADARYYGDFSDAFDLRDALDRTRDAVAKFNALPSELRRIFENDPALLHDWVSDPANIEQAVELGLLSKAALGTANRKPAPEAPTPEADKAPKA